MAELNPDSFQSVADCTVRDGSTLRIPGELMPAGEDVVAQINPENVNTQALMQWHDLVREEYKRQDERQTQQTDTEGSGPADAVPAARGDGEAPSDTSGGRQATKDGPESVEEELENRQRYLESRLDGLDSEISDRQTERREVMLELKKVGAALSAWRATDVKEE